MWAASGSLQPFFLADETRGSGQYPLAPGQVYLLGLRFLWVSFYPYYIRKSFFLLVLNFLPYKSAKSKYFSKFYSNGQAERRGQLGHLTKTLSIFEHL